MKYTTRPASWIDDDCDYDDYPLLPQLVVSDHVARFTGILDADGNEIWREPNPIGFHHPLSD